jgi:P27 family predicted phage terminase small subunit
MPRDLLPEARPIWRAVLREMPPGVILAVDADLLRLYSEAMARYRQATAIYARSGTGLIARRGARGGHGDEVVRHPIHQIVRDWSQEARALATELGLSPTSRARLHVPGEAGLSEGIERELGVPLNRLHVLPAEAPSTPTRKAP